MSLTDLFAVNADAELFKYCAETQELVTLKLRALKHATQDHNEFAVRRDIPPIAPSVGGGRAASF